MTLCLDSSTKSLVLSLSAIPTTEIVYTTHYATKSLTSFTEKNTTGLSNGTANVTIIPTPGTNESHSIKNIILYNPNSTSVTINIKLVNNSTEYNLFTINLSQNSSWKLSDGLRGEAGISLNSNNIFTKSQRVATVALTDGATINVDASLSNVFSVTLGGNRTIANPINLGAGQTIIFKIRQDATGNRTLTWGSAYKFPNTTAPTLSTAANKLDVVSCVSDGTNLYCNFVGGY